MAAALRARRHVDVAVRRDGAADGDNSRPATVATFLSVQSSFALRASEDTILRWGGTRFRRLAIRSSPKANVKSQDSVDSRALFCWG
jgi:hypothetical protein